MTLVEPLRKSVENFYHRKDQRVGGLIDLCRSAADEIERLEKALETAREALEPFAQAADLYDPDEGDGPDVAWAHDFTLASLRRAREVRALSQKKEG